MFYQEHRGWVKVEFGSVYIEVAARSANNALQILFEIRGYKCNSHHGFLSFQVSVNFMRLASLSVFVIVTVVIVKPWIYLGLLILPA